MRSPPMTMALTSGAFSEQGLGLDELPGYGDQFIGRVRLAQDTHGAVRPLAQSSGGRLLLGDREDDGYLLGLRHRLQAAAGLDAAHLGHGDVHHDQAYLPCYGLLKRLLAVGGLHHLETGFAQSVRCLFQERRVVLGKHDGGSPLHATYFTPDEEKPGSLELPRSETNHPFSRRLLAFLAPVPTIEMLNSLFGAEGSHFKTRSDRGRAKVLPQGLQDAQRHPTPPQPRLPLGSRGQDPR